MLFSIGNMVHPIHFVHICIFFLLASFAKYEVSSFQNSVIKPSISQTRGSFNLHWQQTPFLKSIYLGGYSFRRHARRKDDDEQEREEEVASLQDITAWEDSQQIPSSQPGDRLPGRRQQVLVGDPQKKVEKEMSVTAILKELTAIQEQGPQKYCVLGTRHCSYLHQRIIELLAYALVLSGNHVYTSGAGGTHAATIRGALRAERPDLLTVVLPQSLSKQPKESQELLKDVEEIITMPQNDNLTLDVASRKCNSYLLSCTDHLVSFAFHESRTVIEAAKEAKKLNMLVTTLYLD